MLHEHQIGLLAGLGREAVFQSALCAAPWRPDVILRKRRIGDDAIEKDEQAAVAHVERLFQRIAKLDVCPELVMLCRIRFILQIDTTAGSLSCP